MKINLPEWAEPIFDDKTRYIVVYGGRGSGKSYGVADALLVASYMKKVKIICGREVLDSIKDSVHATLKGRIEALGLLDKFRITRDSIICKRNESEFIFKGLEGNIDNIKSIPDINYLWIEEAASLSYNSWSVITPTIRAENSKIIITFNPKYKTDCIYQEFIVKQYNKNVFLKKLSYRDNPFHSNTSEEERLKDLQTKTPEQYQNIWEGSVIENSQAQVFYNKWIVDNFKEDENPYCYYGLDFGFSQDETAAVRCYIKDNKLFITHEAYKKELDIDQIGKYCEQRLPGFDKSLIIADSAMPATISFLKKQGYIIKGAFKGKGSVEDGIAYMRSFEKIVIHPRCENAIREFELYSYKIDKHSNDVTPNIIDAYNHIIDATRYALERCMKHKTANYDVLTKW